MASKKFYVDSKQLEVNWTNWIKTKDPVAWTHLLEGVYKICHGVAIHFHPQNEDEHNELAHEAFILTVDKIKDGRLTFTPGRAPVFNLLTTTVFRHLYSKMNKDSRRRTVLNNLKQKIATEQEGIVNPIV
jgi:hypothetical protein